MSAIFHVYLFVSILVVLGGKKYGRKNGITQKDEWMKASKHAGEKTTRKNC